MHASFATPTMGGTFGTRLRPSRFVAVGPSRRLVSVAACFDGIPCRHMSVSRAAQGPSTPDASSGPVDHPVRTETGQVQHTISREVSRSGVGLHSGDIAVLRLLPAAAGEGRYFICRGDKAEDVESRIPASLEHVNETRLCTCIAKGHARVRTVEHLLSALEGMGVDNCRMEIQGGNEVPLLDGSARNWVDAIQEAGVSAAEDSSKCFIPRKVIVVQEPIVVHSGDAFVAAFPAPATRLTYGIDFSQVKVVGRQWFTWCPGDGTDYQVEVAPARTFAIYEQIEQLRAAGLIKGGSLENALVCSMEGGWLNPPLRFADEPCRHKLLDLVGDLALCAENGHPGLPVGHIVAFKASHQLHVKFGQALLQR